MGLSNAVTDEGSRGSIKGKGAGKSHDVVVYCTHKIVVACRVPKRHGAPLRCVGVSPRVCVCSVPPLRSIEDDRR